MAKRSKFKVSRPITAEAENVPYLPKGETDKLHSWYRQSSTTRMTDVHDDVKGQGYKVMSLSLMRVCS